MAAIAHLEPQQFRPAEATACRSCMVEGEESVMGEDIKRGAMVHVLFQIVVVVRCNYECGPNYQRHSHVLSGA